MAVGAIDKLSKFTERSQVMRGMGKFLAKNMGGGSAYVAELEQLFRQLDVNADGTLTAKEVSNAIARAGAKDKGLGKKFDDIARLLDVNGDAVISIGEFLETLEAELALEECADLHAAFRAIDKDGSGSVTLAELEKALTSDPNNQIPKKDMKEFLAGADKNGDQQIDFEEFKALFPCKQKDQRLKKKKEKAAHKKQDLRERLERSLAAWARLLRELEGTLKQVDQGAPENFREHLAAFEPVPLRGAKKNALFEDRRRAVLSRLEKKKKRMTLLKKADEKPSSVGAAKLVEWVRKELALERAELDVLDAQEAPMPGLALSGTGRFQDRRQRAPPAG